VEHAGRRGTAPGDCFFRALGAAAWGRASLAAAARRLTAERMRSAPFRARAAAFVPAGAYDAACDRLARAGEWVETEVEVAAAAEALGVAVHVRREDEAGDELPWAARRPPEVYNAAGAPLHVWLAQITGSHFVELRPR